MRENHPPICDVGRDRRQYPRDVLVRQSVKAVATHTALEEIPGQRERFNELPAPVVERRVEARHLDEPRPVIAHTADRR